MENSEMEVGLQVDLKEIVLANSTFGPAEIKELTTAISTDFSNYALLRDAVGELEVREDRSPATAVRLGVCYYLMGRFERAKETLANADGGALAQFYQGKAHFVCEDYDAAQECYAAAARAGYDADICALARVEVTRYSGDPEAAYAILEQLSGAVQHTAEYLYQNGATIAALKGDREQVVKWYERAVEAEPFHAGALFGLAIENDRHGNDQVAKDLYQRSTSSFPASVGALLNLGLIYEDTQEYDKAQQCFSRILETYPTEKRAQLYLKDAIASDDQYFDLDAQKAQERLSQVLNIPVTDFELSVRSRNCLHTMGIRTLGDLTRTTEMELLSSKNFGETSLVEIGDMLHSKGLELGQFASEAAQVALQMDRSQMS
ncbi:MAG: DNA-directed RNA polymerase subunit alpha C-terminal domain-containing protein, partial [Pirellulaceae bacterium]|nr:DNA-directed RNA polymerase subunit alpha C-terminal domain-containing protein [Pirellulaceae bacterium]